ncbi:hypothetical protein HY382_03030 [Candidatus Curtissbacteria bacterium]|nr:hypothetical protein [Candidatus Curtissbacteria bacterium]
MINIDSIIKSLEDIFKKLPPLPANAVATLFKITPWLAIIFGILGLIGALAAFGIFTVFAPFAIVGRYSNYGLGLISTIGLAVSSLMMIVAFPSLKAGKMAGWNLLFWSEIISIGSSLLSISVGTILGAVIGLYILFQIKPKYK